MQHNTAVMLGGLSVSSRSPDRPSTELAFLGVYQPPETQTKLKHMQSSNKTVQNATQEAMNQTFPRSVLSVSRDEFGNQEDNPDAKDLLKMNVKEGELPLDLQGHVFIVAPVGSIDSPDDRGQPTNSTVYQSSDGTTPLYNGDGMIYRLDFDNLEAGAFLAARLVKPPCYYADAAADKCQKYQHLKFKNYGITRISRLLGVRNQLNTAFVPLKFSQEESERLLATWDVGRPYEIDPKTLETVTPVGCNNEWKEVTKIGWLGKPPTPFKVIQTSAHPCFDPYTREMFTVNIGRSLSNMLSQFIPLDYVFKDFVEVLKQNLTSYKKHLIYEQKCDAPAATAAQKAQNRQFKLCLGFPDLRF